MKSDCIMKGQNFGSNCYDGVTNINNSTQKHIKKERKRDLILLYPFIFKIYILKERKIAKAGLRDRHCTHGDAAGHLKILLVNINITPCPN